MNINVLLTGGRAPVTLHLARMWHEAGANVFIAESERYHLCRTSTAVTRSFLIAKPNDHFDQFIADLSAIIVQNNIKLLIPTCEETFHIAKGKQQLEASGATIFCAPLESLLVLHHKRRFIQFVAELHLPVPTTTEVTSTAQLAQVLSSFRDKIVLKPSYSRFATNVTIQAVDEPLPNITVPTVVQQFIDGQQYCSYSVAQNGRLVAHSCYPTHYTVGLGATLHFRPAQNEAIRQFVERVVAALHYTGQISFDFIVADDVVYPIECNPRATSGVHLLADQLSFVDAFLGTSDRCLEPAATTCYQLTLPMWLYGKKTAAFWRDVRMARDVVFRRNDWRPALDQLIIFGEMVRRSWRTKEPLVALTTKDIEWGDEA